MDLETVYALGLDKTLIDGEEPTEEDRMLMAADASNSGGFLGRLIGLLLAIF